MMVSPIVRIATLFVFSLCLVGCGKAEAYRYKLTLAVNTPDGVKRASSVSEVSYYAVSIPARGTMHTFRGEALYLDLGLGARPLIVLLTNQLHPKYGKEERWSRDAGPHNNLLSELYHVQLSDGLMDYAAQMARQRGARRIAPADLPDLVTFTDINEPASVLEVDPNNLAETLGPNLSWDQITLEIIDEPVTRGIEQKLKWLPLHFQKNLTLDGSTSMYKRELANILKWSDFERSPDLKRKN